jgi:hypothetical protein
MEETIGECTNLHITYPALVLGFFVVIRANRSVEAVLSDEPPEAAEPAKALAANDIALTVGGDPVMGIRRFHNALRELTGRRGIRDDISRYEAVTLAMLDMVQPGNGAVMPTYPTEDSPLRVEQFFGTLYLRYDERFLYSAPDLQSVTQRLEWSAESPAFGEDSLIGLDYEPRLNGTAEANEEK